MGRGTTDALVFRPRGPRDDRYIEALGAGAFADFARDGARATRALVHERWAHTEVAWLDDEAVGFVIVSLQRVGPSHARLPGARVAHLSAIATDPMMKRRGIGRELLARAEQMAREREAVCMTLTTGVSNRAARALFVASGYQSVAGVADFYFRGSDAVFMHKLL